MVIDSSALIAILSGESEAEQFASAIADDSIRIISAANFLETAIVIESRFGRKGGRKLDELIDVAQLEIVSVTVEQAAIARIAFRAYGKGRHKASLNFGDCFSYALAKLTGEPLLYKGNDFVETDLQPAIKE